jgi:acyl-CoA dehydrogenase
MTTYTPQTDDLKHTLDDIVDLPGLMDAGVFPELSGDLVEQVLNEAGRFAADVIAPLNEAGDAHGCKLDPQTHAVTTAPGWKEAYAQWVEAGWGALPCPPEIGGQGLPILVSLAVQELWNTAASAFGIGTLLTQGAVEALGSHGTGDITGRYLPHMASGHWTGTMVMTESQAGSDLGAIRTRAERRDDGTYAITGTKIFITYGEHDLTENIVHSVLARIEGAPEGTRGCRCSWCRSSSPSRRLARRAQRRQGHRARGKARHSRLAHLHHALRRRGRRHRLPDRRGEQGPRLHVHHDEQRPAACRHAGRGDRRARHPARHRLCPRAPPGGAAGRQVGAIIEHPDVRRMLLDMRAQTAAARAVCFETARALDLARHGRDDAERRANGDLAALLTPVAKAFSTDIGTAVASLGIQVHGGMGYIEETGAAQHLRDARICQIYEGTNGIQAIDLVTRKLPLADGEAVRDYIGRIRAEAEAMAQTGDDDAAAIGESSGRPCMRAGGATGTLQTWLKDGGDRPLASATPYLRLFGLTAGAAGLARGARAAHGQARRRQ